VTPDAAAGNDPDVDGLAAGFVACTLPREAWTHAAHLIVGMWHVDRYGADEALLRLRAGIRRLNESHGTPIGRRRLPRTIARAYTQLLSQYCAACPVEMTLRERVSHLLRSPLADKDALHRFYSRETLMSVDARTRWVKPDVAELRLELMLDEQGHGLVKPPERSRFESRPHRQFYPRIH
jgi:hypothetical protein